MKGVLLKFFCRCTRREVAAGRMAADDELHELAGAGDTTYATATRTSRHRGLDCLLVQIRAAGLMLAPTIPAGGLFPRGIDDHRPGFRLGRWRNTPVIAATRCRRLAHAVLEWIDAAGVEPELRKPPQWQVRVGNTM
jgi:hypothetical protein